MLAKLGTGLAGLGSTESLLKVKSSSTKVGRYTLAGSVVKLLSLRINVAVLDGKSGGFRKPALQVTLLAMQKHLFEAQIKFC